jgi:hypothetical protein
VAMTQGDIDAVRFGRKMIAGSRIDSTEPCSGWDRRCAIFARFSESGDFRVFQHNRRRADFQLEGHGREGPLAQVADGDQGSLGQELAL